MKRGRQEIHCPIEETESLESEALQFLHLPWKRAELQYRMEVSQMVKLLGVTSPCSGWGRAGTYFLRGTFCVGSRF